jgi:hypothetical protein
MMTFWWESTRDLIQRIQEDWFPKARITLGGTYTSLCPEHAKENIPGVHFSPKIGKDAKNQPTDFSLYEDPPRFAGIFLNRTHSANQIANEIEKKIAIGVREFAFFDQEIPGESPEHFENVLDLIVERKIEVKFRALGNLSSKGLTKNLILKMKRAGYRQIFLRDDAALNANVNGDLNAYERGIELLLKHGGFRPRTEEITAMVLVGVPGENLEQTAERLTRLAHVAGSVNLVPYQPTPGTEIYRRHEEYLAKIPLELQNGKLFPFAKFNNVSISDYQELTRLAALLNSKYRNTTFDFLGSNEIAKMVRESIARESWRPRSKDTLPLIQSGDQP